MNEIISSLIKVQEFKNFQEIKSRSSPGDPDGRGQRIYTFMLFFEVDFRPGLP